MMMMMMMMLKKRPYNQNDTASDKTSGSDQMFEVADVQGRMWTDFDVYRTFPTFIGSEWFLFFYFSSQTISSISSSSLT